ncbi:sugar transferase [Priestia aryabhattai]|uniref:sugar transferase n=1 Tax=Priestia TaxID=2800373 RepID=UPI00263B048A|nr:sugar transferase [Priestia megaterium]MDN4861146.1 sugar transferase [Priestia megaterium]
MLVLKRWVCLPENMKNEDVKKYHEILYKKRLSLLIKRIFDLVASCIILILLSPIFLIIGTVIKIDSKGPVIFYQTRVTQYGKKFNIFKFRTMVNNAEKLGTQVTTSNDNRITRVGKFLRKYRLDELPQLINILLGDMSFVGTRPEVTKYVEQYTKEMLATLLLPAGVTSKASISYRDEEKILKVAEDADKIYVTEVLPQKMKYNLSSLESYSLREDVETIYQTFTTIFIKDVTRKSDSNTNRNKSYEVNK